MAESTLALNDIQGILITASQDIALIKVKHRLTDQQVIELISDAMSATFFFDKVQVNAASTGNS